MNPTVKLIAAFAVGFAIPAMAANDQSWYAAHAAKPKTCAIERGPATTAYAIFRGGHKATRACATD